MGKYGIEIFYDLYTDRLKIKSEMNGLIETRTKLQNKIRRVAPAEKETLQEDKADITAQITKLRKLLRLNKGIEGRFVKIQEKTDIFFANEIKSKSRKNQLNNIYILSYTYCIKNSPFKNPITGNTLFIE